MTAVHEFLRDAHVPYSILPHRVAFTARQEAAAARVPDRDWAKVVACFIDDAPVEAIVPASTVVNLDRLLELAGGSAIRLAQAHELRCLYPDCELGAMPPFGPMYRQAVFADVSLASEPEIVFNGGTHADAIAMRWADFARAVKPIIGRFADPPVELITDFRISYSE